MAHSLDHREILRSAGFATVHFDVLEGAFEQRLAGLCEGLNVKGGLLTHELAGARRQRLQVVITRTLLAADRRRIPGIADEQVSRPIVIIGYSRTGTTLLHALLAEDDANRVPRFWQRHQASPPPGERPVAQARRDSRGGSCSGISMRFPAC